MLASVSLVFLMMLASVSLVSVDILHQLPGFQGQVLIQVCRVEMSPQHLSPAHASTVPRLLFGRDQEPAHEKLSQAISIIFKTCIWQRNFTTRRFIQMRKLTYKLLPGNIGCTIPTAESPVSWCNVSV